MEWIKGTADHTASPNQHQLLHGQSEHLSKPSVDESSRLQETMVATRGHPEDFSEVDTSPSKPTPTRGRKAKWAHTPSNLTLIWIIVSLPLIAWDTGYVMLRPHSMPGGWAHSPVWKPYKLYGTIDYIYGWKAFNEKNGFTAAQGLMNIVESLFYIYYVYILYAYGKSSPAPGRGAPKPSTIGFLGEQRHLAGKMAGVAVLVLFSGALMTLSKTILYWLNEYYSGFSNIGHNDLLTLTTLWIIPNGAWIVLPTYMIYVSGAEILQGLAIAAGGGTSHTD